MYICACKSCTYQTSIFCHTSIMWVISSICTYGYFVVRCSHIEQSYPTKILSKSCVIYLYVCLFEHHIQHLKCPLKGFPKVCHFQSCVSIWPIQAHYFLHSQFSDIFVIFNIHPFWLDQESFNTICNMYSMLGLYFVAYDGVFAVTSSCDLLMW